MQTKTTFALCLLLCAQVLATRESRFLLQHRTSPKTGGESSRTRGTGSTARAGITLNLNGPGKVTVDVKSKGIGVTTVKDAFSSAIVEAMDEVEKGGDAMAIASFEANAYGTAIAQALAKARVRLVSTAEGAVACAFAEADAEATATAYATALVDVLAQASNKIEFAEATAAVESIVSVTVEAFATAEAQACGQGVFEANSSTVVLSEALGVAYAEVIAIALAMVTPGASVAEIDVQATGDILSVSTVDGFSASEVFGNAKGNTSGDGGANVRP